MSRGGAATDALGIEWPRPNLAGQKAALDREIEALEDNVATTKEELEAAREAETERRVALARQLAQQQKAKEAAAKEAQKKGKGKKKPAGKTRVPKRPPKKPKARGKKGSDAKQPTVADLEKAHGKLVKELEAARSQQVELSRRLAGVEQALALYRSDPYLYRVARAEPGSQPLAAEDPLAAGPDVVQNAPTPSSELAAGTDGRETKANTLAK